MTQYAYFNSTAAQPTPVLGWIDTEFAAYPNLPSASDLLVLTPAQWAEHMNNPSGWAVQNGTIVAYIPQAAPPTLAQQAAALIHNGLTITSAGTPALDGVYMVADNVPFGRQDIANEAQFVASFSEFTNGSTTLEWPQANGTMVTFPSTTKFMAFAKAVAQFRAATQIAVISNGTLPSASATIP